MQKLFHNVIKKAPKIYPNLSFIMVGLRKISFPGSQAYWESRYANGGTSGGGSYGELAIFKAEVLNNFVGNHMLQSVIEFGCGDGNQLAIAQYPTYIGLDVSKTAIQLCKEHYQNDQTKSFFLYDSEHFVDNLSIFKADLALSLDVLYHLVEEKIFGLYLQHLFAAAERYVIIYSSNQPNNPHRYEPHVRHREFTKWVEKYQTEWELVEHIPNKFPVSQNQPTGSFADFYIYQKR